MLGSKKERGEGKGRKKYACPKSLFFWQTPYAGKRSPWLVRLRGSRLMPVNQMSVYIVYCVFVCCMQLRERSILNSEMADARGGGRQSDFELCCRNKFFVIGAAGNVACVAQWKSQSDFYTGIRTRFAFSAKTLSHFYLMPKCCLFQYVFFLWRVGYALEGSMFWVSKCDFSRLFNTERSWRACSFPVVFEFLVGMICPLMQDWRAFSLTSFEA